MPEMQILQLSKLRGMTSSRVVQTVRTGPQLIKSHEKDPIAVLVSVEWFKETTDALAALKAFQETGKLHGNPA
jgi:hypothetical protein